MKEYHPECHDAGKLVYTVIGGEDKHWMFLGKLGEPWQKVIAQHHYMKEDDAIYFPNDLYVFLSCVADHLAASTVRQERWKGVPNYFTNRLWKKEKWDFDSYIEKGKGLMKLIEDIKGVSYDDFRGELIDYFNSEPIDFLERYRDVLNARAEDVSPGANVVSLYIHSVVVKKFYFLLNELIEEGDDRVKRLIEEINEGIEKRFSCDLSELKSKLRDLEDDLLNELKVNVIYCDVVIPHYIFRVHDLNFFREVRERIDQIKGKYEDNFFSFFGYSFVVLCGDGKKKKIEEELDELIRDYKVVLRVKSQRVQLNQLKDLFDDLRNKRWGVKMVEINDEVEGYLCEVCRLDKGGRYEEDGKVVYLCNVCYDLRERGKARGRFEKYASWEEGYVCALGFRIEFNKVFGWFDILYRDYVEQMKGRGIITQGRDELEELRIKNPLPLVEEFIKSFGSDVVGVVKGRIKKRFGDGNFEEVSDNFVLVHLESRGDVLDLLDLVYGCLRDEMSSLFIDGVESPVRIYFGVGHIKHPFFAFYRSFVGEWGGKDICLEVVGEVPVYMSFLQFESIIRFKEGVMMDFDIARAKIHQMLEIARVSEALGEIAYINSGLGNRGGDKLIEGIGYSGLMVLFKIFDMYMSREV